MTDRPITVESLMRAIRSFARADTELRRATAAAEQPRLSNAGAAYFVAKLRLFGAIKPLPKGPPMTDSPAASLDTEANPFAFELLMPAQWVRDEVAKLGGLEVENKAALNKLAKRFGVSARVMAIRIGQISDMQPRTPNE